MAKFEFTAEEAVALAANFAPLADLWEAVGSDASRCVNSLSGQPESQFWRRTAVRTMAAEMEARASTFKPIAVAVRHIRDMTLPQKQLDCLTGAAKFSTFKDIKLALIALAAVLDYARLPADHAPEWRWLSQTIEVRNRLTHPKSTDEYCVSDSELYTAGRAFEWFRTTSDELLTRLNRLMARFKEAMFHALITPSSTHTASKKVRRNELCHCGSMRKFKHCCKKAASSTKDEIDSREP